MRRAGKKHQPVVSGLNNLAIRYRLWGKYAQVESLFERAVAIQKQMPGNAHPDGARTLGHLAQL